MKQKITEAIEIPEGISCKCENKAVVCKKNSLELKKTFNLPKISINVKDNKIILECKKGNKNDYKQIQTMRAHITNLFNGFEKKFVYNLEACNVHFPMTFKVEGDKLIIQNFLGEKLPRYAIISPSVEVEVKGQKIIVSSPDKEAAGQTAANFEKATKIKGRDRRIFQDGIFITEKPEESK